MFRRLRQYSKAKEEEQRYIDSLHAHRLREFAASRQEAKSRADSLGNRICELYSRVMRVVDCRIAVAPLHVDDYFNSQRDEDKLVLADDLEAFQKSRPRLSSDDRSQMTDTTQGLSFGLQEKSWKTNSIFKSSSGQRSLKM